jgi:hypothetical protein
LSGEVNYRFAEAFAVAFEVFHILGGKNTVTGTAIATGIIMSR